MRAIRNTVIDCLSQTRVVLHQKRALARCGRPGAGGIGEDFDIGWYLCCLEKFVDEVVVGLGAGERLAEVLPDDVGALGCGGGKCVVGVMGGGGGRRVNGCRSIFLPAGLDEWMHESTYMLLAALSPFSNPQPLATPNHNPKPRTLLLDWPAGCVLAALDAYTSTALFLFSGFQKAQKSALCGRGKGRVHFLRRVGEQGATGEEGGNDLGEGL